MNEEKLHYIKVMILGFIITLILLIANILPIFINT